MDTAKNYVERKGWEHRIESAGEEVVCKKCPICGDDNWHFYINNITGLYQCFKCRIDNPKGKGHISSLKQYLGDIIPINKLTDKLTPEKEDPDFTEDVLHYHNELKKNPSAYKYLLKRRISEEVIDKYKLGYTIQHGQELISIPSWEDGIPKLIKFRKYGEDTNPQMSKYIRRKGSKSILLKSNTQTIPEEIIFVEGEMDGLTLISQGYENVVANTGGASTLIPEWYDYLKEIPKIYVCYDNDPPGQKAVREIVAKRLGFGRVFNITLPEGINDINEFFCKGHTKGEFDSLIRKAKPFSLPGVLSLEEALGEVFRKSQEGIENFLRTPWKKVNKLMGGGLRKKDLIVIGAPPKTGKTTFSLQISYWLAKKYKIPVLFFCLEMPFESLAKFVVCMNEDITEGEFDPNSAGLYAENIGDIPLYLGYDPKITQDQLVETFKEAQNRYGIEMAVFDNLHWLVRTTDNVVSEVGLVTRMFKTLAMEMDIPLILIAQPRKLKNQNTPMNYWDLKDSAAIPADADILCILHREKTLDYRDGKRIELEAVEKHESFSENTFFRVDAGRYTAGGQILLIFQGDKHYFTEKGEEN